jgi:hypothetical protein
MELHEERNLEKLRVASRRNTKFSKPKVIYRTHWSNHAGTYKDDELKYPKFWRGQKPTRVFVSIKSHSELIEAVRTIQVGERNQDHYHNVCGLYRERLRVAQSLRDKGLDYSALVIVRAGFDELNFLLASK